MGITSMIEIGWISLLQHFLTPQRVDVFEKSDKFGKFDQPSRRFIQFEEQLLTDSKGDQSHWSTVSFNNCLLRIPGSLNSKQVQFDGGGRIIDIPYDARVRIVQKWNGNIPTVERLLLMEYYNHLQFGVIRDIQRRKTREVEQRSWNRRCYGQARECINLHGYGYIEKLFDKPLGDFRKLCIWRIFIPYFINIRKLPRQEAFNRTKSWLDRCNSKSTLNFNPTKKIDYALNKVCTFTPIH
jgi:hypothetical protein